jgi:hypothetical protein
MNAKQFRNELKAVPQCTQNDSAMNSKQFRNEIKAVPQ